MMVEKVSRIFDMSTLMRLRFLGKDPDSQVGQSPTLFATDRTDPPYARRSGVAGDRPDRFG
jgi:hypothetical protein